MGLHRIRRVILDMQRNGPILDIAVEPILTIQEILQQDGEDIPSIRLTAVFDTGASNTVIQSTVFQHLGLASIGQVFFSTPSTTEPITRSQYRVRLILADGVAFESDVAEAPLGGQTVQCLLGRDILQHIVMTYNGPKNSYTLNIRSAEDE